MTVQKEKDIPHIIITGNPVDGLSFIGPFKSSNLAAEHGNLDPHLEEWWIAPLQKPDEK